jgi:hypothetical protein
MKRTQIQLPDRLYNRLKERAAREETSLAEVLRKAGEYYLSLHPKADPDASDWHLPEPEQLGEFLRPEEDWRLLASEEDRLP